MISTQLVQFQITLRWDLTWKVFEGGNVCRLQQLLEVNLALKAFHLCSDELLLKRPRPYGSTGIPRQKDDPLALEGTLRTRAQMSTTNMLLDGPLLTRLKFTVISSRIMRRISDQRIPRVNLQPQLLFQPSRWPGIVSGSASESQDIQDTR